MVSKLSHRFRGVIHHPGSAGYHEARSIWNGQIDRRPALVDVGVVVDLSTMSRVRLDPVKRRVDPANLFRHNQNIRPDAGS